MEKSINRKLKPVKNTKPTQLALLQDKVKELEKQLSWYKSFFENATDAVFIIQPDTWCVLDANEYAATLLGMSRDELVGTKLPQFRRIFKLLKKTNAPMILSELSLDTPNNSGLMVEVSARFVEYEGQKLIQAIARDIGEQYALTDKLVQADKLVLLGQLSAGIAHEIRNPLAAVNLNLQVLQRKIPEERPEYGYVVTALQGVERISKIVDLTLNFSRPTIPDIQGLDINALLLSTLELISTVIKKKDITVDLKIDDKLPLASADAKQIQQVFINLLTNAADAIVNKGKITIRTYTEKGHRNKGDYIVISISDTGIGIPAEDLPKIFNPFFTRKAEGTGLGLPITQRILHNHNGVIDVESRVGVGTVFYVKLPVSNEK